MEALPPPPSTARSGAAVLICARSVAIMRRSQGVDPPPPDHLSKYFCPVLCCCAASVASWLLTCHISKESIVTLKLHPFPKSGVSKSWTRGQRSPPAHHPDPGSAGATRPRIFLRFVLHLQQNNPSFVLYCWRTRRKYFPLLQMGVAARCALT